MFEHERPVFLVEVLIEPDAGRRARQYVLKRCLAHGKRVAPHVMVDDGPVLENIMLGEDVDVTMFPAPKWHEKDGGRYIGTGTYSITRDPEENWLNAGAYRAQVHDRNSVGIVMAKGHHGFIHREKYFKRGEPMPIVMVLGGDPIAFFYGGVEAPYGMFELDIVGGMRRRPTKMVSGKITGLPFPAHAEIVLEGYVTPDKRHAEGPFGVLDAKGGFTFTDKGEEVQFAGPAHLVLNGANAQ